MKHPVAEFTGRWKVDLSGEGAVVKGDSPKGKREWEEKHLASSSFPQSPSSMCH